MFFNLKIAHDLGELGLELVGHDLAELGAVPVHDGVDDDGAGELLLAEAPHLGEEEALDELEATLDADLLQVEGGQDHGVLQAAVGLD